MAIIWLLIDPPLIHVKTFQSHPTHGSLASSGPYYIMVCKFTFCGQFITLSLSLSLSLSHSKKWIDENKPGEYKIR